jgi:hypothetical protein
MKHFTILIFFVTSIFGISQADASDFRGGINWGHYGGMGWDFYGSTYNFAQGLPLVAKLTLGYVSLDPGNATEARRIFINNNQGGTVQKKGSIFRFSLDFMYPFRFINVPESYIYFGPRYALFKGNFKFIGNNEDFNVTSNHWGAGLGLEMGFPLSKKFMLSFLTGADYYLSSVLSGHDTSYAPNGEKVNPREDYEYQDADEAINQPKLELRLMLGFSYKFGK